ncbi:winged helix-turn-helix transcriptional regulator [Nocardioides sp. NPDC051685]|uniref:winged helix-turn-helix transcriptional regulator n=1 Tax=Nocardioides sp. NPDC051685 TaxID=3364334 RepID=UPI003789FAEC
MVNRTDTPAAASVAVMERQGGFADRDAWTVTGTCRMERALALIGTRSAMVLLREVFFGATRFEDLVNRSGLSEAVAAGRLKELVGHGVLTRRPYQEPGSRTRQEYVLTDLGGRLFPVLVSLMEWGELLEDDHDTGVELIHKQCGSTIDTEIRCGNDHPVALGDTAVRMRTETPRTQ